MLKRKLFSTSMIIAVLLVFTLQIGIFGLTAATGEKITGIVYASSGVPLSAVSIYVSGADGSGHAVTDGNGLYLINSGLPTGDYTVTATKTGYINAQARNVTITAGHETIVDIFMNRSGGISGQITDNQTHFPILNINVTAALSNGETAFYGQATTNLNGYYEIATNLGTGTYNVSIPFAKGFIPAEISTVSVEAGNMTIGVNLAINRSGIISGQVTTPSREPIAGATVNATSSDGKYSGTDMTDVTGNYSISSGLGTANYTVTAYYQASFNTTQDVAVTAGQETPNVDIRLIAVTPPPAFSGTITGTVTDANNSQPILGARIVATGNNTSSYGSNYSDNDGNYVISQGLQTDVYTITASASGYQSANVTLISVFINQTTSSIDFQLTKIPPRLSGSISGTVTGEANPIPEFAYSLAAMIILAVACTAVARLSARKTEE